MPDLSMSQQQQQYFNETWQTHETQYKVKKIEKKQTDKNWYILSYVAQNSLEM